MPARVLVHGLPKLLMDAVGAILTRAPDVTVIARPDGAADIATVVLALQPDVVVLEECGVPGLGSHTALFAVRDGLRVVAVSSTGGDGVLSEMGASPVLLPGLSAAQLVRAVRGVRSRRTARETRDIERTRRFPPASLVRSSPLCD